VAGQPCPVFNMADEDEDDPQLLQEMPTANTGFSVLTSRMTGGLFFACCYADRHLSMLVAFFSSPICMQMSAHVDVAMSFVKRFSQEALADPSGLIVCLSVIVGICIAIVAPLCWFRRSRSCTAHWETAATSDTNMVQKSPVGPAVVKGSVKADAVVPETEKDCNMFGSKISTLTV